MTNLINQITINGVVNTFYGYRNPLNDQFSSNFYSSAVAGTNILSSFLTTAYGSEGTQWRFRTDSVKDYLFYAFRFPVEWETLSGTIGTTWNPSNARASICLTSPAFALNSTATTGSLYNRLDSISPNNRTSWDNIYIHAVANKYSFLLASFSGANRETLVGFSYIGWAKSSPFLGGGSFPSALITLKQIPSISFTTGKAQFVATLNQSLVVSATNMIESSPALSCSISTPGANASEVVLQRVTSPNWFLGTPYNMIRMQNSCVVGKIYKNIGVDPDTGQVETDQKAFWMCVGSWGTDKIGMRVWTEGIV